MVLFNMAKKMFEKKMPFLRNNNDIDLVDI